MAETIRLSESDLLGHLKARMAQRGVTKHEIEQTLNEGWEATDAKAGTLGKSAVFPHRLNGWERIMRKRK